MNKKPWLDFTPIWGGFGIITFMYLIGIPCKAALGFEPPAQEYAMGAIATVAGVRQIATSYESMSVRRSAIEHNVTTSNIPGPVDTAPSTIPP